TRSADDADAGRELRTAEAGGTGLEGRFPARAIDRVPQGRAGQGPATLGGADQAGGQSELNDQQLLRYSRHILLDEVGIEGQERLRNSHALIVGAGGLGCPAALYLAASGVGKLTLADPDKVDLT